LTRTIAAHCIPTTCGSIPTRWPRLRKQSTHPASSLDRLEFASNILSACIRKARAEPRSRHKQDRMLSLNGREHESLQAEPHPLASFCKPERAPDSAGLTGN
jgi:hypothetical protein